MNWSTSVMLQIAVYVAIVAVMARGFIAGNLAGVVQLRLVTGVLGMVVCSRLVACSDDIAEVAFTLCVAAMLARQAWSASATPP